MYVVGTQKSRLNETDELENTHKFCLSLWAHLKSARLEIKRSLSCVLEQDTSSSLLVNTGKCHNIPEKNVDLDIQHQL